MKVYIGLGNPGSKYLTTRHNIGFLFLDWLSQVIYKENGFKNNKKFHAETLEINKDGEKILLVKPTTFMNLSGDSYSKIKNFYDLEDQDFLIIYDDIDLNFEDFRLREKGSAGTHNGMRSILQHASSDQIPRLRLGVNNQFREHQELSDFVLSNFSKEEQSKLHQIFEKAHKKLCE